LAHFVARLPGWVKFHRFPVHADFAGQGSVKRLYLLRHAKAVPADPERDDFARELTVRGMHDAASMARYLRKNEMVPDLLLVSGAARTRQTAELVRRELEVRAEWRDTLYLAEPGKILAQVHALAASLASVMVVGHNPGIEDLASLLAREPVRRKERVRRDVLEEKFPTAALAVLDFDVAKWRELKPGEGKLVDFVRPKDL
jgi:phosphohistidine phosphatase